ncbi:MAG: C45 family autoproteolytic acyltransferase/hydrolase [Promethearchaeia archaeon]
MRMRKRNINKNKKNRDDISAKAIIFYLISGLIFFPFIGIWLYNRLTPPTIIDIKGDNFFQLGQDYGTKCKDKINSVCSVLAGLTYLLERTTKKTIKEYINYYDPYVPGEIKDIIKGMAKTSGVSYEELFILNLFFDIYPDVFEGLSFFCSAFIITEKAPNSVGGYFGRTVDSASIVLMEDWQIILRVHPPKGNDMIIQTGAGFVGPITGLNSEGVSLLVNFVSGDVYGKGIPMLSSMFMTLLYSNSTKDAVNYLTSIRHASSWNFGIIDKNSTGAIVEVTNELNYTRWDYLENNGWLGATNHFISEKMESHNSYISESSEYRYKSLQKAINDENEFTLNDAIKLLRSSYDLKLNATYKPGLRSICNNDPLWSSMCAFIAIPKKNYVLICIGNPNQNDFYLISFNDIIGPLI